MFADPLVAHADWSTITVDSGEDISLPVTERAGDHSRYGSTSLAIGANTSISVFVGHQYGRRNRFTLRVDSSAIVPDVLIDNQSSLLSQSCYVVFDCPPTGPFNYPDYSSGLTLPNTMLKMVGGFLVSVDTADPLFARVIGGET